MSCKYDNNVTRNLGSIEKDNFTQNNCFSGLNNTKFIFFKELYTENYKTLMK